MRVKIFVDFWNFQIAWNAFHGKNNNIDPVKIPWKNTFPDVLTQVLGKEAEYAGTHVYASVNPRTEADRRLRSYLKNVMDSFPGYKVTVKERRPASPIRCTNPDCRKPIIECPHCREELKRTSEKGVDAALIVDVIQMANDNIYDRAILVSADGDYVGAVDFIQSRMKKQISHMWFQREGFALRKACWDHYVFEHIMAKLVQPVEE